MPDTIDHHERDGWWKTFFHSYCINNQGLEDSTENAKDAVESYREFFGKGE